jgi:hypothetical protein
MYIIKYSVNYTEYSSLVFLRLENAREALSGLIRELERENDAGQLVFNYAYIKKIELNGEDKKDG